MFGRSLPPLILVVLLLASGSSLQAGASNKNGNPFGNGTFFQTTGTFSAVIRGENLSGTMLFSTGISTNMVSTNSSGSTTISYLGSPNGSARAGIYLGNAVGMWDPSSGSISGQIWGGQMLSGTNGIMVYPEIYNNSNNPYWPGHTDTNAPSFPIAVNTVSNVVIPPNIGTDSNGNIINIPGTNYVVTNTIYVMPTGSNSFNDTAFMNGDFSGSTQNKYPNQTFTAQGTMIYQAISPQSTNYSSEGTDPVQMAPNLKIPITVQGIRVSDTYSSFKTISNNVPYSFTPYTITNFGTF